MSRELKLLEGKIEAQSHIICVLLEQLVKADLISADAIIRYIDNLNSHPTSILVDPVLTAEMKASLDGYAEMLDDLELSMKLALAKPSDGSGN